MTKLLRIFCGMNSPGTEQEAGKNLHPEKLGVHWAEKIGSTLDGLCRPGGEDNSPSKISEYALKSNGKKREL
ncbi:MAG: hypothetical protein D3906_17805 [Candidatus Electrothrix sp. AUS1_2]|nr:hypothetical protein [Candidatus Electrothrix sp. AUS1_2]